MRFRVIGVVVLVALACAAIAPSAASAATRVVEPGQSIQAAIDAAQAGDRIVLRRATYRESLLIGKDRLRLQGSGATLLPPPTRPAPTPCSQFGEGAVTGICVVGEVRPPAGEAPPQVVRRVVGVRITGITVRGFWATACSPSAPGASSSPAAGCSVTAATASSHSNRAG